MHVKCSGDQNFKLSICCPSHTASFLTSTYTLTQNPKTRHAIHTICMQYSVTQQPFRYSSSLSLFTPPPLPMSSRSCSMLENTFPSLISINCDSQLTYTKNACKTLFQQPFRYSSSLSLLTSPPLPMSSHSCSMLEMMCWQSRSTYRSLCGLCTVRGEEVNNDHAG